MGITREQRIARRHVGSETDDVRGVNPKIRYAELHLGSVTMEYWCADDRQRGTMADRQAFELNTGLRDDDGNEVYRNRDAIDPDTADAVLDRHDGWTYVEG